MFHSPFSPCVISPICSNSSSRSAVKNSGGGKVSEGKGKQIDTLYLALVPYLT